MDDHALRQTLKVDEGLSLKPYRDGMGIRTIGYGHQMVKADGMTASTHLTLDQAEDLLEADVTCALAACQRLFPDFYLLPEVAQAVLANMAFNLGEHGLKEFVQMRQAIARRQWRNAAQAMRHSLWYTQVPRRAERLAQAMEGI